MMALKKELAKLKSAQGFKPYDDMPGKKAPDGGVGKGKPPPTWWNHDPWDHDHHNNGDISGYFKQ